MPHVITEQSVTFTTPVTDAKGEVLKQKIKFGNREVETDIVEHTRLDAGQIIEVDDETAAEWIKKKLARVTDPVLDEIEDEIDEEIDPTA